MINIKNYKNLKSINRDFEIISNYFKKNLGKYWWFLNFSRLDLAPLGIPKKEKYYIKLKYFILIYCSLIKFILVKTFFSKNTKIKK